MTAPGELDVRALLIDDEDLVLEGLEAFLQVSMPDLSLDKTSELAVAVELAAKVPYELTLLDWHLTGADGRQQDGRAVIEALRAGGSRAPILVVSGGDPTPWPERVFELGLAGFVPKRASGATLLQAMRIALDGGVFLLDRALQQRAGVAVKPPAAPTVPTDDAASLQLRFPALTERQAEVFRIMLRGASNKEIARELDIGVNTVHTHVRGVLAAVGAQRRGEAVFRVVGGQG